MDHNTGSKPPRSRGRPPKVKRVASHAQKSPPVIPSTQATTSHHRSAEKDYPGELTAKQRKWVKDNDHGTPPATPAGSIRPSSPADEYIQPAKRQRTTGSPRRHTSVSQSAVQLMPDTLPPPEPKAIGRATILPARRSTRHTTVQATQISEGTLRPPGPPNLEAALNISLRNLESETWLYLWAYNKKHPGGPLPTPAAVKEASPRVRVAAEAVDEADRELEDAIDEIMLANTKQKPRVGSRSTKPVHKPCGAAITDSENLEHNSRRTGPISSRPESEGATGTDRESE